MKVMNAAIRISSVVLCAIAGVAPALAQGASHAALTATSPASAAPAIHFEQMVFDFGTIDSGVPVKHDFIFTNTGNQLLEITQVKPSCGCTTAGNWDKQVEPGQTGKIPVQFHTLGFGGTVRKSITVMCNDPARTNVILQLNGTIWKPIDVAPAYAIFAPGPDLQTNETRVIKIVNHEQEPLTLADPVCSNRLFQTQVRTVKAGQEFELHVTTVPPFGASSTSTAITLKTSSKKMPTIAITAFLTPQPVIAVRPPQITLPPGALTTPAQYTVTIQNNATNALSLSEPRVNAEGIDIQLKEIQSGRLYSITTRFPAGFKTEPGKMIAASVKSSHPQFPTIRIPVLQTPAPSGALQSVPAVTTPQTGSAGSQVTPSRAPTPLASHKEVSSP